METCYDNSNSCPICYNTLTDINTDAVDGCGHEFCRDCLGVLRGKPTIEDRDGFGIKVVCCPMCRSPEEASRGQIKLQLVDLKKYVCNLEAKYSQIKIDFQNARDRNNVLEKKLSVIKKALKSDGAAPGRRAAAAPGGGRIANAIDAAVAAVATDRRRRVVIAASDRHAVDATPAVDAIDIDAIDWQRSYQLASIDWNAWQRSYQLVRRSEEASGSDDAAIAAVVPSQPAPSQGGGGSRRRTRIETRSRGYCWVDGCTSVYRIKSRCVCGNFCCKKCKKCRECRQEVRNAAR